MFELITLTILLILASIVTYIIHRYVKYLSTKPKRLHKKATIAQEDTKPETCGTVGGHWHTLSEAQRLTRDMLDKDRKRSSDDS